MKILYVEDNPTACEYVEKGLSERGFQVDVRSDGAEGLAMAMNGVYDLLILDVMLPGMDGFAILRELRKADVDTPAIFLSARVEAGDRIQGLNLGADDYLVKPFAFGELVARIRAISRRSTGEPTDGRYRVADLVVDVHRHAANRGGRALRLTPKEFSLLEYLIRNTGHVLSRTMITEKVWGYGFESYSNLIEVHINHLRKKLDQGSGVRLLHTVKGVGYVLEDRSDPPYSADETGAEACG